MPLEADETMRSADGVVIVGFELDERAVTLMSAGQPNRRQVGVYPTREGVSLKLASLVSISKLSPLKTLSLKVQEPRSMPQITGVDFIIIKKQQKMALLIILILSIITQTLTSQPTLILYTHSWCPPCLKAKQIFNKIKAVYPSLSFQLLQYSNKTVLYRNKQTKTQADIMPFPTLMFNCSGRKFTYQNDLTFDQLSYSIQTMCLQRLPQCSEDINEELFHMAVRPHKNVKILIQEMQNYPIVKICEAKHANFSQYQGLEILKLIKDKTLFMDYFSHNLRSYLIQSQKLAVALITKNSNSSKSKEFFATYLSLENFMDKKAENQSFKLFNFDLKEEHKKQIVFLGLCYNSNISKCVSDPLRKRQVLQAQSHIPKLLQFFNLNIDHLEEGQFLVAFRFRYPKFQTHLYHHSMGTIDQKFLFWLTQILEATNKQKSQISRLCLWNSLVHRVSGNSLEDLETYNYIQNRLKMIREKYDKKMTISRFQQKFHNEDKFTLCLEGQLPKIYVSNKDADVIIEVVEEKFRKDQQQNQDTDL